MNTSASPIDVSGYVLKDNDDTHSFVVPAGTIIAGTGFLALDVDPSFGLGGADSARLFAADGVTLLDTYSWTAHATTTYGRCPRRHRRLYDDDRVDQGRGQRLPRRDRRLALAGRPRREHRRRGQHVRHQPEWSLV